jgi:hypothetical protein
MVASAQGDHRLTLCQGNAQHIGGPLASIVNITPWLMNQVQTCTSITIDRLKDLKSEIKQAQITK